MAKFKPNDLVVAYKVKNPRFGHMGWEGKVDKLMEVDDSGEQVYGVSLYSYGAAYKYKVKESDIMTIEEFKVHLQRNA